MAFGRLGSMGAGFGRLGARAHISSGAVGGAALLANETDGFAVDFTYPTDSQRVAVKVAGAVTSYGLDAFFTTTSTTPKMVYDVAGALVWAPHNYFVNSAAPATQSVTTVVGQNYTVTVTGSGSMTGSAGAAGVASAGSPLTYTATTTTSTFTKAGSPTVIQMNRGAVATAYLAATAAVRVAVPVDYDPVTHAAKGVAVEPTATNLLLNSATLSTQSATVTAAAHTLSFFGTGTITLTGTSTAGPLTGTGANNRVSLTFTPTAGSLTCTVTGTVTNAQLELGSSATSFIPTFSLTTSRGADQYTITPASINHSATAGSWYCELQVYAGSSSQRTVNYTSGGAPLITTSGTGFALLETTFLTKTIGSIFLGPHKIASAWQSADRAITADGLTVVTDAGTTAQLAAPSTSIFVGGASPNSITGHIRKVFYVPRRMSNAELVSKTA